MPSVSQPSGTGPFLILIDGLPREYTWKDLKDLIRWVAHHGIWADVKACPYGLPGRKGWVRAQRYHEAHDCYVWLTTGNPIPGARLHVELWDTTPDALARRICCNYSNSNYDCRANVTEVARLLRDPNAFRDVSPPGLSFVPPTYSIDPAQAPQYTRPIRAPFSAQPSLVAQMGDLQIRQQSPQYAPQYQDYTRTYPPSVQPPLPVAPANIQQPGYVYHNTNLGVNTDRGCMLQEHRGIFISGINFKAKTDDIKRRFSNAGKIVECKKTKESGGKWKGTATILYQYADDADRAVVKFNESEWMGRKLLVRFDKNATTIAAAPSTASRQASSGTPCIVNGSE